MAGTKYVLKLEIEFRLKDVGKMQRGALHSFAYNFASILLETYFLFLLSLAEWIGNDQTNRKGAANISLLFIIHKI